MRAATIVSGIFFLCIMQAGTMFYLTPKVHASTALKGTTVFDSAIYRDLFSTEEMRQIFTDQNLIQQWMNVEVALAEAEAELGVIPAHSAEAIKSVASVEIIDIEKFRARVNKVGRGIKPLLEQMKDAGGSEVRAYLHWGGTTQDIMDTGTVLQIKQALPLIQQELQRLILSIADLAEKHKATPMVSRTNGQDAIPTTYGLVISTYLAELERHYQRLEELTARLYVGQFGGAVGTLASTGEKGLEVRANMMKKLGLKVPLVPWNPSRDNFAELVQKLGLVHGTLNRIAVDVNNLARTAVDEIKEGEGGASSTMPHKRNPRASEFMGGLAHLAKLRVAGAMEMLEHTDTRQGAPWISEWSTIPEIFMLTSASLDRANRLFAKIIVKADNMAKNFEQSHNFVMSEALMMNMAPKIGRGQAMKLIKAAIKKAPKTASMKDVILADDKILQIVGEKNVDAVLDPTKYLGHAPQMVQNAVNQIRKNHSK